MDDLISRAAALEVIEAVKKFSWSQSGKVLCGKMYSQIKDLPAVDAAPVRHGVWREDRYKQPIGEGGHVTVVSYFCSVCNGEHYYGDAKYCPNCGAKMDGVTK